MSNISGDISAPVQDVLSSASVSVLAAGLVSIGRLPIVQNVTPVNGATVTVNPTTNILYVSAGTLASVQITLATTGVVTNHTLRIATLGALTSVSLGGATIAGGIGTLAANGFVMYLYDGTNYVRIG